MFQSIQRRWQRALSARAQQQVEAAQEQGGGGGSSLVEDCSLVAQHRICLKKGKGFVQKEKKNICLLCLNLRKKCNHQIC